MLKKYIWINGKISLANRPAILVNDVGLLRGYGVFDFMRTFNGRIFHYLDHYRRFTNSARLLDLKVSISAPELEKIIYQLMKKNKVKEASIRLLLTGGPAIDGLNFHPRRQTLVILVEGLYELPAKLFKTGAKLITFDYERLLPEAKNLNYIWAVKLQSQKKRKGATEILYTTKGQLLECSTSNFFLVKNGQLLTAKEQVLGGITRKIVFNLAQKLKIPIAQRSLRKTELKTADEVFITATNKNILPIIKVDELVIGDGKPGPITRQLIDNFAQLTKNY